MKWGSPTIEVASRRALVEGGVPGTGILLFSLENPSGQMRAGVHRGPGAVQAEAQGCGYDSQCKGERVCESGRCVDPVGSSSANQRPATVESTGGML